MLRIWRGNRELNTLGLFQLLPVIQHALSAEYNKQGSFRHSKASFELKRCEYVGLTPAAEKANSDILTSAYYLPHRGKSDDLRFAQKATAIQKSTAIHGQWDFYNHNRARGQV